MPTTVDPRKPIPRRFVPPDADMGRWEEIERLADALLARRPEGPEALVTWLEDESELRGCVLEERARRYIAMTSQTDDRDREAAYLSFVREIDPRWTQMKERLNRAYLANPHRQALTDRYRLLDRRVETWQALYREENVPLQVREAELSQQYQKVVGAMTVTYRGQERTLQQMGKLLEEPDRAVRQEAWELITRRRLQDREALDTLFDQLREVRQQIARNAGFATYRDYIWLRKERFDYTAEDCERFHAAVEAYVVPLAQRLHEERGRLLGVEALRPWDTAPGLDPTPDPLGRPPLRPFTSAAELLDGCEGILARVDDGLAGHFRFMREEGLLDLESRKGKAPGGYQQTLHARRWPFIFMNAVGRDADVETLLHEAGHAFNAVLARDEPLIDYRHPGAEFAEVASMGMELLSAPHLDVFYPDPADRARAFRIRLETIIRFFPWCATIDAFQHWLYTHPDHTADDRGAAWVATFRRFNPAIDWTGHEEALAAMWHRQQHLFVYPFYYVEYGIAQLGALQLWLRARADYAGAVTRYKQALALGGSRPLPALFEAAGMRFAFGAETVAPLAEALADELARLPAEAEPPR